MWSQPVILICGWCARASAIRTDWAPQVLPTSSSHIRLVQHARKGGRPERRDRAAGVPEDVLTGW